MGIDAELYVLVPGSPSDEQIKQWAFDAARCLGHDKFFIDRKEGHPALEYTESRYRDEHSMEPGRRITQDGEDEIAPDGFKWLQWRIFTRYYREDCSRGNILFLCALAEWSEQNISGGVVWYGGDSSGVCAEPWPDHARRALRTHFYGPEGDRYYYKFREEMNPPRCALCPEKRKTCHYGFGSRDLVSCGGCGQHFASTDKGKTWTEIKEQR